jgi:histidyl-tRNA synthetase
MTLSTQPYKGARDFYPEDKAVQVAVFDVLKKVAKSFGYQEYDGPFLEPFELYAAKTGEEIINEQLYSFIDRGDRKVAMRPEMTPTLARMIAAKVQELPKPIRWFSIPNLWRYERPQKGRLREHWQLNVDLLGGDPMRADLEILNVAVSVFRAFGAAEHVQIRVNNRRLMDHLFHKVLSLDAAQTKAVAKAIDARDKIAPEKFLAWLQEAGLTADHVGQLEAFLKMPLKEVHAQYPCQGSSELVSVFDQLKQLKLDQSIVFSAGVMRGLDYYTGTVFEAYDVSPENRRALFGGGRYDNLVGLFGKAQLSGVGFGLGDVTLRDFLETHQLLPQTSFLPQVGVVVASATLESQALELAQALRDGGLRVVTPLSIDSLGPQLKAIAKLGAPKAVVVGDAEWAQQSVQIKDLVSGAQQTVKTADLVRALTQT